MSFNDLFSLRSWAEYTRGRDCIVVSLGYYRGGAALQDRAIQMGLTQARERLFQSWRLEFGSLGLDIDTKRGRQACDEKLGELEEQYKKSGDVYDVLALEFLNLKKKFDRTMHRENRIGSTHESQFNAAAKGIGGRFLELMEEARAYPKAREVLGFEKVKMVTMYIPSAIEDDFRISINLSRERAVPPIHVPDNLRKTYETLNRRAVAPELHLSWDRPASNAARIIMMKTMVGLVNKFMAKEIEGLIKRGAEGLEYGSHISHQTRHFER